jgi:NAD(P)-dependent dehydrogenase (short-subunit alcohol dehydrogenase family)
MMVSFDLTGRSMLVTGGTLGIGLGIVRQLLKAGARVAISSRSVEGSASAAASLNREFGGGEQKVIGVACDLGDAAAVRAMADEVIGRWGAIDGLVCNAADQGIPSPIAEVELDRFARVLQTNIVNNFELARRVAPTMADRGEGSITFITSIAASTSMPSNIPYAAAKAAITSMARSLAGEYVGKGVRVNCVAPGLIRTESSRQMWEDQPLLDRYLESHVPMRRIGEPEEIGAMCVVLASSAGAYITGAVIPVDGGRAGLGHVTGSHDIKYGDKGRG